tara:strand:- start:130 stop:543 length:414 start_codon:yes stop_codon:yes gene_type:complete
MGWADGAFLDMLLQTRRMLDVSRAAESSLLANLSNRLDNFDVCAPSAARPAPCVSSHTRDRCACRQRMNLKPSSFTTGCIHARHHETQDVDLLQDGYARWCRGSHPSSKACQTQIGESQGCDIGSSWHCVPEQQQSV